jgi:hypothetical protein
MRAGLLEKLLDKSLELSPVAKDRLDLGGTGILEAVWSKAFFEASCLHPFLSAIRPSRLKHDGSQPQPSAQALRVTNRGRSREPGQPLGILAEWCSGSSWPKIAI